MKCEKIGSAILCAALIAVTDAHCEPYAGLDAKPAITEGLSQHQLVAPETITYDRFIGWSNDPGTIVLDAWEIENLFHVAPEAQNSTTVPTEERITQKDLDRALAELIPNKDSRVVLFCYQTFQPTRNMPAWRSVASSLSANGYTNVFGLDELWHLDPSRDISNLEREVRSRAKPLPSSIKELMKKANH